MSKNDFRNAQNDLDENSCIQEFSDQRVRDYRFPGLMALLSGLILSINRPFNVIKCSLRVRLLPLYDHYCSNACLTVHVQEPPHGVLLLCLKWYIYILYIYIYICMQQAAMTDTRIYIYISSALFRIKVYHNRCTHRWLYIPTSNSFTVG